MRNFIAKFSISKHILDIAKYNQNTAFYTIENGIQNLAFCSKQTIKF